MTVPVHRQGDPDLASANRPGVKLTPEMTAVVRQVAGRLPKRLTVCTGTNHNRLTTSGSVSDHWDGNGVDLCSSANEFPPTGGGYGDTVTLRCYPYRLVQPARPLVGEAAGGGVVEGEDADARRGV